MQKHLTKTVLFILLISLFFPTVINAETNAFDRVVITETIGEYDETAATAMKERIRKIHPAYINVLDEKKIEIKLINFPLTELAEYAYLKGEIPRGWEHTGYTWDDVPGAGGNPTVARIGYSDPVPGNIHDAVNLELHETAHAVDEFVLNDISFTEEFRVIHEAEQLSYLSDSYFEHIEEYFAEAFAYYYLNEVTNAELKQNAPLTYDFIKNLPSKIPNTDPPVLTLNGDNPLSLNRGDSYDEPGATVIDKVYGDLSDQVEISGEVNTDLSGEYKLIYSAKNEAGQTATATRTIRVVKSTVSDYDGSGKSHKTYQAIPIGKYKTTTTLLSIPLVILTAGLVILLALILRKLKK